MNDQNYSPVQDLKEAEAMIKALDSYVRGDQLYGTVGTGGLFSGGRMPMLTIGGLLLRLRRLQVLGTQGKLESAQIEQVQAFRDQHASVRRAWTAHHDAKMKREANSRLDAMKMFFDECASSMKLCARVYLPEVLRRTTVEELFLHMETLNIDHKDELTKARATDSRLRRFTHPAAFVWAQDLEAAYDQKRFWWMYSFPPTDPRE